MSETKEILLMAKRAGINTIHNYIVKITQENEKLKEENKKLLKFRKQFRHGKCPSCDFCSSYYDAESNSCLFFAN